MSVVALSCLLALVACSASDPAPPSPGRTTVAPTLSTAPTRTASPTPTPSPAPTPTAAAAGTYLALGDSLAVGVGATRPDETGYVARLFAEQPGVEELRSLAVSGETSGSMIRNGQLASAIEAIATADPPVMLVTLDIGGNDLLQLLRTETCAAAPQGPDCLRLLALTLEDFEANYRQIVGELTDALDARATDARLAVMTYFNAFSGTDAAYEAAGELALLGADGRVDCEADDARSRGMNDIIACVGEELGAIPVDIQPAFAGLGLELTHIGAQDIHANDQGYGVIADLFASALDR